MGFDWLNDPIHDRPILETSEPYVFPELGTSAINDRPIHKTSIAPAQTIAKPPLHYSRSPD